MTTDIIGCKRGCEIMNRPAYIVLFKGDDSDFQGNQSVDVVIDTELDTTGMKAHFRFMDFVQDFNSIPENKTLNLVFPNAKTSEFPLGAADATLRFEDASGKFRTVSNRIHIVVTNSVHEAYDNEDSQSITVTVKGTVTWEMIEGKPTFATVATSGSYNDLTDKPTIPSVPVPVAPSTAPSAAGKAADAKATGDALYTGFTEWEYTDLPEGCVITSIVYDDGYWSVTSTGWSVSVEAAEGDALELSLFCTRDQEPYDTAFATATRHLITPTKTSQLTNDGPSSGPNVGHPYATTAQIPTVPSAYTSTPAMDGVGRAGSSTAWAKGDHVHPSDTSKANASDLPYALVTPGEWEFSGSGVDSGREYKMSFGSEQSEWTLNESTSDSEMPWIGIGTVSGTGDELSVEFDGVSITATRASLPGHLLDRANNLIDATTGNVTLTLPPFVAGKVRDLLVACTIGLDGNDEPWSVIFQGADGEEISFKAEGDDAASATFPVPDAAGDWWYSLTERAPHVFSVSLKQLQSVSQPTQTQGGS